MYLYACLVHSAFTYVVANCICTPVFCNILLQHFNIVFAYYFNIVSKIMSLLQLTICFCFFLSGKFEYYARLIWPFLCSRKYIVLW